MPIVTGQDILAADVTAIKTMTEAHKTRHQSGGADDLFITAYYVSETLRNSNDTERIQTNIHAYTLLKGVLLNADLSACRIKFDLASTATDPVDQITAYACIYKNGAAIGTARSQTSATYTTYSEDFTGFASGDLIQIYAKTDHNAAFEGLEKAYVRNMRFYYDKHITHIGGEDLVTDLLLTIAAISVTNQDP